VARAGRFGTKGLAITFVSDESDARVLNDVQERFEVNITELPEEIDLTSYSKYLSRLNSCGLQRSTAHHRVLERSDHRVVEDSYQYQEQRD